MATGTHRDTHYRARRDDHPAGSTPLRPEPWTRNITLALSARSMAGFAPSIYGRI